MKLNEVYSSSGGFLKADDIGNNKPVVTIAGYTTTERDYNDGKGIKKQIVLSFVGREKVLGLNFGNANDIAKLVGSDDVEEWIGKSIKLYVKNEKIGDALKDVIRIFPELPEQVPFTAPTESAQFTGANRPPDVTATPPDDADAPMNW